jgi:hypothetical protein
MGSAIDSAGEPVPRVQVRRWALLATVVALVGLLGWSAAAALSARSDLMAVRADLLGLTAEAPTDVDELQAALSRSSVRTARARARLAAPGPALVAAVPVLGRSLAAGRDIANAADSIVQAADRLVPRVSALQVDDGRVDTAALGEIADALAAAADDVRGSADRLADTPTRLTPGVVDDAVREAREVVLPAAEALEQAASGARAVRGLLGADRPRTIVLGVMNNAEARGAGGYAPSFAVITATDGRVEVGPFRDVNEVQVPPEQAERVPASGDYSRRWGRYLADTTLWKNVTMSPHAPDSLAVLCEVARLRPGVPCDGAVLMDVPALAEVMTLSGPVRLQGEQIDGEALVEALLVDAYADAEELGRSQAERRASLLAAADTALTDLIGSGLTGLPALRVLATAAAGRHLAVWSADEQEQVDLVAAGLSGSVDPGGGDLSLVSLNQLSAGKLDYYLRRQVEVEVVVGERDAVVEQRVRLDLEHPDGLPAYVLGIRDGRLDHLVDLGMAASATDVTVLQDGAPARFELVPADTGSARAALLLSMQSPQSTELVLRYRVPLTDGRYRLEVRPQPLARAGSLVVRIAAADGLELQGMDVADGQVVVDEPLSSVRTFEVRAQQPGFWDRPVPRPW